MRRSLEVEIQQGKGKEFTEERIHSICAESHSMSNRISPSIRHEQREDEEGNIDTINEECKAQPQDLIQRDKHGKQLYELKGNSYPKKVQQICLKTGILLTISVFRNLLPSSSTHPCRSLSTIFSF